MLRRYWGLRSFSGRLDLVHCCFKMARSRSPQQVPVIDLFAGPGGLGEGFSGLADDRVHFDVLLSVEKDAAAHQTLLLRSFFRQLRDENARRDYYQYLNGNLTRDDLFGSWPEEAAEATSRCLHLEMGQWTTSRVYAHIERAVMDAKRWVLVGGPPCQAYSMVGRSRLAKLGREAFEQNDKHVLYREYLRILAKYLPPVFVMENVKGLLSATYGGTSTFERILSDLSSPTVAMRESLSDRQPRTRRGGDYTVLSFVHTASAVAGLRPEEYVMAAEKFGIPQKRHRVILLGIRSDLSVPAGLGLRPSAAPSVHDVLADLPALRSQLSRTNDTPAAWVAEIRSALDQFGGADEEVRAAMISAARCLRSKAGIGGRAVPRSNGCLLPDNALTKWIVDPAMEFVCNHETRKHIPEDLLRYLFMACYARVNGGSPKLHDFPAELLPNHRNVPNTLRYRHGYFNDRFRVQVEHEPATTVMSHICKDGHYFIHHDPTQCRSWTVREAARVQTFPDNYFFEGTRTDQYRQVGNAVPPYLALQIALVVAKILSEG